ncbi:hypothetical protein Q4551_13170 [Oceanobacter sp. 5_MG-2023]|uniref:hypothetical protein n=1 Tax=Oceanobacter sp. 5_MG-2023 TaxID=3062645 RepID=UPI0026E2E3B4|nr:hypothetical protein [Oceanobacter sp. 5_MG-2023]MDO6683239.1 hypothetical protein [Oceanobacter sp. 5_MG-2023]
MAFSALDPVGALAGWSGWSIGGWLALSQSRQAGNSDRFCHVSSGGCNDPERKESMW